MRGKPIETDELVQANLNFRTHKKMTSNFGVRVKNERRCVSLEDRPFTIVASVIATATSANNRKPQTGLSRTANAQILTLNGMSSFHCNPPAANREHGVSANSTTSVMKLVNVN